MAYYLAKEGLGATTLVHVGGDVVVGLPHPEVVKLFQDDPATKAIVMFGEIGGTQEEDVAALVEAGTITKPIIAFVGGKAAKSGTRFSHAGAIIEGNRGTYEGKVNRLREVDVTVVDTFGDLPNATSEVLEKHGIQA
jgi:succinyl-CoA synthetase alpha subunit